MPTNLIFTLLGACKEVSSRMEGGREKRKGGEGREEGEEREKGKKCTVSMTGGQVIV